MSGSGGQWETATVLAVAWISAVHWTSLPNFYGVCQQAHALWHYIGRQPGCLPFFREHICFPTKSE